MHQPGDVLVPKNSHSYYFSYVIVLENRLFSYIVMPLNGSRVATSMNVIEAHTGFEVLTTIFRGIRLSSIRRGRT